MNVLIYADEGTSVESVRQTKNCLRSVLSDYYAVTTITARQIIDEPWIPYTALLIIPGGADLPYCRSLNGPGNQKIKHYVRQGGKLLGICAGAYYGCAQIEFEAGTPMEVSGPRELAFYNGSARGTVFKGFEYGTEKGAVAAAVLTKLGQGDLAAYLNGGCLFEGDADAQVLARYAGPVEMDVREAQPAAIVYKKVGKGDVVLSGVHLEYDVDQSSRGVRELPQETLETLRGSSASRMALVRALLSDFLHLKVHQDPHPVVPRLSTLHLTSLGESVDPSVAGFMKDMVPILEDSEYIRDKTNVFHLINRSDLQGDLSKGEDGDTLTIALYQNKEMPTPRETSYFNHRIYFDALTEAIAHEQAVHNFHGPKKLGATLMYGEVVTSTSTMLEGNLKFLKHCPHGLIIHGTQQTAGRGRGSNVWVNPPGVMAVSGVYRVPQAAAPSSLVFLQYIVALANVEAIKELTPVDIKPRLKWPNDIYLPDKTGKHVKIGGLMVSLNIFNGEYVIVFGSGTNVDNAYPTTSINLRLQELNASPIKLEQLLAKFMAKLDRMFHTFFVSGFQPFETAYYAAWLHTGAHVFLERYGGIEATIHGISPVSGMLIAEDIYGQTHEFQPDGNSFDIMRGLIKAKK